MWVYKRLGKKMSESEKIERMKGEKKKGENPFFLLLTGCFFFWFFM